MIYTHEQEKFNKYLEENFFVKSPGFKKQLNDLASSSQEKYIFKTSHSNGRNWGYANFELGAKLSSSVRKNVQGQCWEYNNYIILVSNFSKVLFINNTLRQKFADKFEQFCKIWYYCDADQVVYRLLDSRCNFVSTFDEFSKICSKLELIKSKLSETLAKDIKIYSGKIDFTIEDCVFETTLKHYLVLEEK